MKADKTATHIAQRIKYYRELEGLTPAEFARLANISASQYRKIERGESSIRFSTFDKITTALGVDPSLILDGKPTLRELFRVDEKSPDLIKKFVEKIEGDALREGKYWVKYLKETSPELADIMVRMIRSELKTLGRVPKN